MADFRERRTFACLFRRAASSLCTLFLLLTACNVPSRPEKVPSTWRFETIYTAKQFSDAGPHWLAMDTMGYPHLAYGGNALYYAWFDGKGWHYETASSENGSGKYPGLVLDSSNSPHIIHAMGLVGKMTLVHTFLDQTGWRSENIDANFCGGRDLDVQVDPQGILTIVYSDGGPACNDESVSSSRVRFIQQVAGRWEIQTAAQPGLSPSLAYDGHGRTLISYVDAVSGNLNLAVRENGIWSIHTVKEGVDTSGLTTSLIIDPDNQAHIFYTHKAISTNESVAKLEHAWQDKSGWQSETLLTVPNASPQVSAFIDAQGGINVLYLDRELKLLRRKADGWLVNSIPGSGDNFNSPTLAMDRQGQLVIAYMDVLNYSIVYGVQNGETWDTIVVDRGDDLSGSRAALAFNPGGEIHAAFYSQRGVNYAWKENDSWQNELVVSRQSSDWFLDEPIDLLVDPQNNTHIFYKLNPETPNGLMDAIQISTGWVSENVPVVLNWSRPVISPEGWPVIFDNSARDSSTLFYRTPKGWRDMNLEGMQNGLAAIGYTGAEAASTDGSLSPPYILFYGGLSNTMTLRNPALKTDLVLPAVSPDRSIKGFTLGFESPEKPVVLVYIEQKNRAGDVTPGVLYVTRETSGWKSYEKIDNMIPWFPVTPSDKKGDTHYVVESGYGVNDSRTFYLVGSGSHWKITPVGGEVLTPGTNLIGAALYDKTGDFCALFLDVQANSILLGCLDNIK